MKGTMSERGTGVWWHRVLTGYTLEGKPVQRNKTVKGNRREAQTELAKFVAEGEVMTVAASCAIDECRRRCGNKSPSTVRAGPAAHCKRGTEKGPRCSDERGGVALLGAAAFRCIRPRLSGRDRGLVRRRRRSVRD